MTNRVALLGLWIALGTSSAVVGACSRVDPQHMEAKAPMSGGEADVRATFDKDQNNSKVDIKVHHLAEPGQAFAGTTSYVAWVRQTQGGQPAGQLQGQGAWRLLGALDFDPSDRDGKLSATTPERSFELLITAEGSARPSQPSKNVVFQKVIEAQHPSSMMP